jgi:tetratricopeptide (TPR) repeat protein
VISLPNSDSDLFSAGLRHVLAVLAHPLGPAEIDRDLVDALLDGPFATVDRQRVITLLIVGGALTEPEPGRFLVRPLPADAAGPVHQDTIRLLVERHVQQAVRADRTLHPHTWHLTPAVDPGRFPSGGRAVAWFDIHREVLLKTLDATIEQPALLELAVPLAEALDGLTAWTGYRVDRATTAELGIAALMALHFGSYVLSDEPDRTRRHLVRLAVAHVRLARARTDLEEHQAALAAAETAIEIARQSRDPGALADALDARGRALHARGQVDAALLDYGQALDADHAQDDVRGEGLRRHHLGSARTALGEHDLALTELRLAADALDQVGDRVAWARVLTTMGAVHRITDDTENAFTVLREALAVLAEHGADEHLGDVYAELARTERDHGDPAAAADYWRVASQHYRLARREGYAVWVESESTAT